MRRVLLVVGLALVAVVLSATSAAAHWFWQAPYCGHGQHVHEKVRELFVAENRPGRHTYWEQRLVRGTWQYVDQETRRCH